VQNVGAAGGVFLVKVGGLAEELVAGEEAAAELLAPQLQLGLPAEPLAVRAADRAAENRAFESGQAFRRKRWHFLGPARSPAKHVENCLAQEGVFARHHA